ncbi:LanC-like protein GCL2 [Camellia lanceoleosa]|uniref:LanC-like protein GCL2 n=1 Tax=Camellia lanceoleosa TaxID=1840588 RepID=A0ACC0H1T6_9ERIC|nr:LanC-like protein GCL2 [Camellia lanceoleosa]
MTDRFFLNEMPDLVEENEEDVVIVGSEDSLMKLLLMPYSALSERLKRAGLDLKETVVVETWGITEQRVADFTLYSGTLGTGFLQFKAYQVTNNEVDLKLCSKIVKACDLASSQSRDVTFICGRAGVCALGAVVANHLVDDQLQTYYLSQFKEIKIPKDLPDELLYGRAGFLWACLFLNKHIGEGTIPSDYIGAVVNDILKNGRALGVKERCPFMFEWYGEKYWGAAHGMAGIMHVLMYAKLSPDEAEEVECTLKYMIKYRFPSGNYPSSEQDCKSDCLVHWCHGAPGMALTLIKAAEVFGDQEFLEAAVNAAGVVWNRGLLKRVGICHGISGNTFVFLSLYRLTGNKEFLYTAKTFTCFLLDRAHRLISEGEMHGGDNPYSLFEGTGGMAYLFLDMTQPTDSKFPAYEL